MPHYTIVSYRPNGDDYCRGCLMASSSSDFYIQETTDIEEAAGWLADTLMADHKAENAPEVCKWEVTILVDGRSNRHDDGDDDSEAESARTEIENRARLVLATRLDEEKQKKEAEQARLNEEAARKKAAAQLAKIDSEKAEYLRLRALYGDSL